MSRRASRDDIYAFDIFAQFSGLFFASALNLWDGEHWVIDGTGVWRTFGGDSGSVVVECNEI